MATKIINERNYGPVASDVADHKGDYINEVADLEDAHALALKALRGALRHNNGVKPQYHLPASLIREIEVAIKAT